LQGHIDLYRSSPPLSEIDHPDHLKPSAYQRLRINRPSNDPLTDEQGDDTDDDIPLAYLLRKPSTTTSKKNTDLSGGDLLPSHPKKSKVFTQKRKATVISVDDDEPSR
jgi:hypothetical protein